MASLRVKRFANLYKDSVTLMQVAAHLRERAGIEQASCLMATPANLAQLGDAGLDIGSETAQLAPSDLLVVVRGEVAACDDALAAAAAALESAGNGSARGATAAFELPLTSIALGVERAAANGSAADLALISVPGDYAATEARKALALGLHVMLFSDNVSVDDELAVKTFARERGLLVMGPDCGTAIVNGVPLGFANVVRRGDIGLVAASGTGLQEVTCRIHNGGGGVSQALGTGGRDLKEAVGGITMLQGLEALSADAMTRVIVLISKPPAGQVARRIEDAARAAGKPVVVHFLGAAPTPSQGNVVRADSLRDAADKALALARGEALPAPVAGADATLEHEVEHRAARLAPGQHAVRALFTGGTFCYEAQLVFLARGLACASNAPAPGAAAFDARTDAFNGHVLLDLGEDEYTRGRPHPMIDPELRNAAVQAQGAASNVAVVLFDVVLGYGSHADPAAGLAAALSAAQATARAAGRELLMIGHVCGTDGDPQDRARQVRALEAAGAIIVGSNVEAALLAAHVAQRRGASPAPR